jgi:hypothetical protein
LLALDRHDLVLADRVVGGDVEINRLRYEVEEQITASLSGSGAGEARLKVAAVYVISDLERMGDHAEGIAKVALMLGPIPSLAVPRVIGETVVSAPVEDWGLPDPAGQPLATVRAIRDDIDRRVHSLLSTLAIWPASCVLDCDRLDDLSDGFALVKRRFEHRVEILPLDNVGRGFVVGIE